MKRRYIQLTDEQLDFLREEAVKSTEREKAFVSQSEVARRAINYYKLMQSRS